MQNYETVGHYHIIYEDCKHVSDTFFNTLALPVVTLINALTLLTLYTNIILEILARSASISSITILSLHLNA